MDKRNDSKTELQQFQADYEEYRSKLNLYANQRSLPDRINQFLVTEMGAQEFDHTYHLINMGVDAVTFFSGKDLTIVHDGIDYYYDFQEHKDNSNLARQRKEISAELISIFECLQPAETYTQALAQQKLYSQINPSFLDKHHHEQFRNLSKKCDDKVHFYAKQSTDNKLKQIQTEHEKLRIKQIHHFELTKESIRLQEVGLKKIDSLALTTAKVEQVDALQHTLEEQGIAVSEHLRLILLQHEAVYSEVKNISDYLAQQEKRRVTAQAEQSRLAELQGLSSTCNFLGVVAKNFQSKELAITAMLGQGSVQIYGAVQSIITGGLSGLAMLNPLSAIGMVGLNIASFFQKQKDPNKVFLKQLTMIRRQIRSLHNDVMENHALQCEQIGKLLNLVDTGFIHIDKYMGASVSRRIDEIQKDLTFLLHILEIGFREVLLDELSGLVTYASGFERKAIRYNEKNDSVYELKLCSLSEIALQKSSSEILTGEIYGDLLKNNNITRLIDVLSRAQDVKCLPYLLGLLLIYARDHIKISSFQPNQTKQVVQINVWALAIRTYLSLWRFTGRNFGFDSDSVIIGDFQSQAEGMLHFLTILQTDEQLYRVLFNSIISSTQLLQQELDRTVTHHTQTSPGLECDVNQQLVAISGRKPSNPTIIYNIPEDYQKREKATAITNNFFSANNLLPFLARKKITVPDEFLLAEKLGLGRFQYRFHDPESLKKEHHTHGGYKLKSGQTAGLEISFIYQGQVIPLYAPGKSKEDKDDDLNKLYKRIILNSTQRVYTAASCKGMLQVITQHLLTNKKKLCLDLLTVLSQSRAYQELIKSCHFLKAYLFCAGFGPEVQQLASAIMPKCDYLKELEHYEKFGNSATFPMPTFTPVATISAAREKIILVLSQAKDSTFRESYFKNNLIAQIHGVLLQLNQHLIQRTISIGPMVKSRDTLSYPQIPQVFFSSVPSGSSKTSGALTQLQADIQHEVPK